MSRLIEIDIGLNPEDDDLSLYSPTDAELVDINTRALPLLEGIRRGDVVHFEEFSDYRNEGKLIYDGAKLISLNYEFDDYGCLPPEFTVNEFGSQYFLETIDHNSIVHAKFDSYVIDGKTIKAKIGDVEYTIECYINGELTQETADEIMTEGVFMAEFDDPHRLSNI